MSEPKREILQEVELCPWGCGEIVLLREWFKGRPKQTIVRWKHEDHRETCTEYHHARVKLDEELTA